MRVGEECDEREVGHATRHPRRLGDQGLLHGARRHQDRVADEIKKAYRRLARANHPDSHPDDAVKHEKFKAVAEAYDVVGDADKRTKYDQARELFAPVGSPRGGSAMRAERQP